MDTWVQSLSTNPYFVIAIGIVGVVSLILTVYWKSRKQLCYSSKTNLLVDDNLSKVEGLEIFFKGKAIETLAVTSIKIFNCGNSLIDKKDIYKNHEIKIVLDEPEIEVYSAIKMYESSDTINATVISDNKDVPILFDSLEKGEFIVLNVYHTGSIDTKIKVSGKIKEGKVFEYHTRYDYVKFIDEYILFMVAFIAIFLLIGGFLARYMPEHILPEERPFYTYATYVVPVAAIAIVCIWRIIKDRCFDKWGDADRY